MLGKEVSRVADEKIFIFENITQMYPRGQSHLERDSAHLLSYWFMPTAEFLSEKDQALGKWCWEHGWSLLVFVSSKSWESGPWLSCVQVLTKKKKKPKPKTIKKNQ